MKVKLGIVPDLFPQDDTKYSLLLVWSHFPLLDIYDVNWLMVGHFKYLIKYMLGYEGIFWPVDHSTFL